MLHPLNSSVAQDNDAMDKWIVPLVAAAVGAAATIGAAYLAAAKDRRDMRGNILRTSR